MEIGSVQARVRSYYRTRAGIMPDKDNSGDADFIAMQWVP